MLWMVCRAMAECQGAALFGCLRDESPARDLGEFGIGDAVHGFLRGHALRRSRRAKMGIARWIQRSLSFSHDRQPSATSRHPWSTTSEWPRSANSTSSVLASE